MEHITGNGDTLEMVKGVDKESIDLIVTSPPYWAQRIYNHENELGCEESPFEYIEHLVDFFDQLRPYLKETGNLFVNLGDTYFGSGPNNGEKKEKDAIQDELVESILGENVRGDDVKRIRTKKISRIKVNIKSDGKLFRSKQLMLIPSRFAIAMQEAGWLLREDIIWHKPNPMPNGVRDRFLNTYEHIFHFVKGSNYYFDLDSVKEYGVNGKKKNAGDVWDVYIQHLQNTSHSAYFPEKLVDKVIRCASPAGGWVMDPFLGTGTTWVVADRLGRNFVGFEMNPEWYEYAKRRYVDSIYEGELIFE